MPRTRRTPPRIMVFHRQTGNDADWKIGNFVEDHAADIANELSDDPKATIGTWLDSSQTEGWAYAGHSLHPRHQNHWPNGAIAIYYIAWEGRIGFDTRAPLLKREDAQFMGLPKITLIRLVNDGEFTRFARVEDVIRNFAWEDVHEEAQIQLKAEVWTRWYDRCFEGDFPYVTLKSRTELMRDVEDVKVKAEEEVEVKIEEHSEHEGVDPLIEAASSSVIKTQHGVTQPNNMHTTSISRHKRRSSNTDPKAVQKKIKQ